MPVCDIDENIFAATVSTVTSRDLSHEDTVYHIHDIATKRAGLGIGRALMQAALAHASSAGFARAQLVAVMGMEKMWGKPEFGFTPGPHGDTEAMAGYAYEGIPAVYMSKELR